MIVLITSADTEMLTAQTAIERLPNEFPPVRLAGTSHLQSRGDTEAFLAELEAEPAVVVVRVLGGKQYFETGLAVLSELAQDRSVPLIVLPGTRETDPELTAMSNVSPTEIGNAFDFLSHGGVRNFENLFSYLGERFLAADYEHDEPRPLPRHGLYHPDLDDAEQCLESYRDRFFTPDRPAMAILFYRAHWISGTWTRSTRWFGRPIERGTIRFRCSVTRYASGARRPTVKTPKAPEELLRRSSRSTSPIRTALRSQP